MHVFTPVHVYRTGCVGKRKKKYCLGGEDQNKQKIIWAGTQASTWVGTGAGIYQKVLYLANIFWGPEGSPAGPLQVLEVQGP